MMDLHYRMMRENPQASPIPGAILEILLATHEEASKNMQGAAVPLLDAYGSLIEGVLGQLLTASSADIDAVLKKASEELFKNVFMGFYEIRERREALAASAKALVNDYETHRANRTNEEKERALGDVERAAIRSVSYVQSVVHGVAIDPPLRLPEFYHEIEDGDQRHLKQHYYRSQYLPISHPLRAPMDSQHGVDRYRDDFIQRASDSKRILESRLRLSYHCANQYKRGAFPLLNFPKLNQITPLRYRIGVRKSNFINVRAQENFQLKTYRSVASNFKLTSNRTADMFLAREMGVEYKTQRVM